MGEGGGGAGGANAPTTTLPSHPAHTLTHMHWRSCCCVLLVGCCVRVCGVSRCAGVCGPLFFFAVSA